MPALLRRAALESRVRAALARSRAVALIGPRQVGKTTLARRFLPADSPRYFDLEDARSLRRLDEPMTALETAARPGGHRRGPAAPGALPGVARAHRPGLAPRAVPDPGQCLARAAAAVERVARRATRDHRGRHACTRRSRRGEPRSLVEPGRLSTVVPGRVRPGQRGVARVVPARDRRAGPARARTRGRARGRAPLLEHGCALARSDLECGGSRPLARRGGNDDPALPRLPVERVPRAPATTVVREPGQAAGQGAQGVCARQRSAACRC